MWKMKRFFDIFVLVIGLFGSVIASDGVEQEDFFHLDAGESTAILYVATENEIKKLFVQATHDGWNEEQFAAVCSQLVEQMCVARKPAPKDSRSSSSWYLPVIFCTALTAVIAGVVWECIRLDRAIERLGTIITQENARTRLTLVRIGDAAGVGAKQKK